MLSQTMNGSSGRGSGSGELEFPRINEYGEAGGRFSPIAEGVVGVAFTKAFNAP